MADSLVAATADYLAAGLVASKVDPMARCSANCLVVVRAAKMAGSMAATKADQMVARWAVCLAADWAACWAAMKADCLVAAMVG